MLQTALEGAGEAVDDSAVKPAGKKGESSQTGHKTSSLSCFGMPQVADDEAMVEIVIEARSPALPDDFCCSPCCTLPVYGCELPQSTVFCSACQILNTHV